MECPIKNKLHEIRHRVFWGEVVVVVVVAVVSHFLCFGAALQAMGVCLNSAAFFFQQENKGRPFVIKPISSPLMKPLLVFVNPKSGGNQVSHFL